MVKRVYPDGKRERLLFFEAKLDALREVYMDVSALIDETMLDLESVRAREMTPANEVLVAGLLDRKAYLKKVRDGVDDRMDVLLGYLAKERRA